MFDSGVPAVKPAKNQPVWPAVLAAMLLTIGFLSLMYALSLRVPQQPVPPVVPQEVHIVADDTKPSPTATVVACSPGMEVGTICRFSFTPTPLPNCPPTSDRSLCVYTGVENFRERKK